jgi:hypothetical protein
MPFRFRVELDDVEGHISRYKFEDLTGEAVTIRTESGDEVQGHAGKLKFVDQSGQEVEGHVGRYKFEKTDPTQDDTEGHGFKFKAIELEVDDAQAHLLQTAGDRGEPVYVRFPDGAEVTGHRIRWGEDTTGEDVEGHRRSYEDQTGDDVEGHGSRH